MRNRALGGSRGDGDDERGGRDPVVSRGGFVLQVRADPLHLADRARPFGEPVDPLGRDGRDMTEDRGGRNPLCQQRVSMQEVGKYREQQVRNAAPDKCLAGARGPY